MTEETQRATEVAGEPDPTDENDQRVMGLLSEHVPLSLLVDLADPEGPASDEILQSEGKPEDAWWVQEGTDDTAEGADDSEQTDAADAGPADQAQDGPSDRP